MFLIPARGLQPVEGLVLAQVLGKKGEAQGVAAGAVDAKEGWSRPLKLDGYQGGPDSRVLLLGEGVRGDTAQGGSKPATMETDLVVQVPLFIEIGDVIRIDTRTGKYMTRA